MSAAEDQPPTSKRLGTKKPGSAIGRTGLHGAPAEWSQLASPTGSRAREPVSSPARPVQYTLRLSYDESDSLGNLVRTLRRTLGRPVDQSTVLRALIELAGQDQNLADSLTRHLTESS